MREIDIIELSKYRNIDLRSEHEFKKSTIPGSINLPILRDLEFKSIGKEYKDKGQKSALKLGLEIVSGDIKNNRISEWYEHIKRNKGCYIFCYRGGLRSEIAKEWLLMKNVSVERISGGYKKVRSIILEKFQSKSFYRKKWIILGGLTGSGKTILLNKFKNSVDIEGLANHRGSAFGRTDTLQDSCANFENKLIFSYMNNKSSIILFEDESRTIGKATLPNNWYKKMQTSSLIILDVSMEERVENILEEYIVFALNSSYDQKSLKIKYISALEKIQKRLGGVLYKKIRLIMEDAFNNSSLEKHREWIFHLLYNYYDPMYNHKLKKRKEYIVHRGDLKSCNDYIKSNS